MRFAHHPRSHSLLSLLLAAMLLGVSPSAALAEASPREAQMEESAAPVGEVVLTAQSDYTNSNAISGDELDGVTVRIRPGHQIPSLAINNDGFVPKNVAHLYNIGRSSRFLLERADSNSYYIHFFHYPYDTEPSKAIDARVLDVDSTWSLFGGYDYSHEDAAIHVTGEGGDSNKKWQIIPTSNGLYQIMNKRSGKYWKIEDTNKNGAWDNNDKLVQTSSPWEFEIEIVNGGPKSLSQTQPRSSYTFSWNGKSVNAANWMGCLDGSIPITDLSIPGVHDAGTCAFLASGASLIKDGPVRKIVEIGQVETAQCQQLYIEDLLAAGVRYLDLRCNVDVLDGGVWSPVLNHTFYCADSDDTFLTVNDVWRRTNTFWNTAEGANETFIWQIAEQDLQDAVDIANSNHLYEYFESLVKANPSRFYIGDHVPTLSEARGKIIILSKLNTTRDYSYDGTRKWALDISAWGAHQEEFDDVSDTVKVTEGSNYEVWVEDNYKTNADDKWTKSIAPSLDKAQGHRDAGVAKGKYPWVIIYTSASAMANQGTTPISAARNINPKLKSYLVSDLKNYFTPTQGNGRFFGIVCSDFTDQQLCQFVYRQNFMMDMPRVSSHSVTYSVHSNTDELSCEDARLREDAKGLFDADQLAQAAEDANLKVWLDLNTHDAADGLDEHDVALLQKAAADAGATIVRYATLGIYKQVGDGEVQKVTLTPELLEKVNLTWKVPQDLKGQTLKVLAVQGDAVRTYDVGTSDQVSVGAAGIYALASVGGVTPQPQPQPQPMPQPSPWEPQGGSHTTTYYSDSSTGYTNDLGSHVTTTGTTTGKVRRLAGLDRYASMAAIVDEGFASSAWAVLACGNTFADALSASGVAGALDAPVILTDAATLSAHARDELSRLGVTHVLIMGGEGAISASVEAEVAGLGIECSRVSGPDRNATSAAAISTARDLGSTSDTVIICTGTDFADALSIASWAYATKSPIVLAGADGMLPDSVVDAISQDPFARRILIVGGEGVVSSAISSQLGDELAFERIAGPDRYATSVECANFATRSGCSWDTVAVTSGRRFPDALTGSALIGRRGGTVMLADATTDPTISALREHAASIGRVYLLGGEACVTPEVARAVEDALS